MQSSRMCLSWWLQKSSASLASRGGHLTLLCPWPPELAVLGLSLAMCGQRKGGIPAGGLMMKRSSGERSLGVVALSLTARQRATDHDTESQCHLLGVPECAVLPWVVQTRA